MLIPADQIATKEVLNWRGIHLLHFAMSSCSQKVRILLNEKQIPWTSHPVNLASKEQKSDWYRGINPKAVVPVLVHDGVVHTESNDILKYLDELPAAEASQENEGSWFPTTEEEKQRADDLLELEDNLHKDLRAITFTYVMPGRLMNEIIPDDEVQAAATRFADTFAKLEERLTTSPWLCGERITLPDIAWFITLHRAVLSGYPLNRHPHLAAYYRQLRQRPAFQREINEGGLLPKVIGGLFRSWNRLRRATLAEQLLP